MTEPQTRPGTYVDRILESMEAGGDRPALINGERRLSCAEAGAMILRLAAALRSLGLRKGDSVALLTGNNPDGVLAGLAVHLIGCRLVITSSDAATSQRGTFLQRAETAAIVFDPRIGAAADLARESGPALALALGPAETGQDLLALAARFPAARPDASAEPGDISTVFHTGGTTGRPKMVLHGHPFYDAIIFWNDRPTFPEPRRILVPTPLSHTSGHYSVIVTLLAGGTVVLLDRFDAAAVIDTIQREGITTTILLPAMLCAVLDHPSLPADGLPTLAQVNYGGGPASPSRLRQALHRLGPVLRQVYALTEAHSVAIMTPQDHDESVPGRLTSCGKPVSGLVEVSVRDKAGEVAPGEVGEVCVRGSLVMTEYWKDPDLTEQALRDGWLHTGDLGRFDEDGYLYIVDRISDLIVTGIYATNIYPSLLVDVLTGMPGVRAAAVVGVPDEIYGEAVHAVCVTEPEVPVDAAELRKRAVDALGPMYEPQAVTFVDSLPYTALGKLDKKALRQMVKSS